MVPPDSYYGFYRVAPTSFKASRLALGRLCGARNRRLLACLGGPWRRRTPAFTSIIPPSRLREAALLAFNLCILDPGADVDLRVGHENGNRCLAYLSTVEAAKGSALARLVEERQIPILGKNENWGSTLLDIRAPGWQEAMVDALTPEALRLGYDGLFLDTVDSLSMLEKAVPKDAAAFRGAMVGMIRQLHERYPDKSIVINRGFDLLPDLRLGVGGVGRKCVSNF
ncbi:MAG: endo alpha-1,4 polygalactosaminidase [Giesbergeria sp.]